MHNNYDSIVIGAGFAGLSAAKALAEARSGSSVLLLNGEDRLPYKRTKISKNIAKGYETDAFAISNHEELAGLSINLTGLRAKRIDRTAKTVVLSDGSVAAWKTLILATGATPKQMFTADTAVVRTADDGETLLETIDSASSVAVIGGGVLGIEVTDQMVHAGKTVMLFCKGKRVMPHELNDEVSGLLKEAMTQSGVRCHFNAAVSDVIRTDAGFTVQCGDDNFPVDAVVECTGSEPDTALAKACGLQTDTGIVVNENLQTSDPSIFAAGDCTQLPDGTVAHLWHQAEDQGRCAGRNAAAILDGTPLSANPNRPRRLKCEAFGLFLFSINADLRDVADRLEIRKNGGIYQEFGFLNGKLISVVMAGDKARAKLYERAVWEGLSRTEVEKTLFV